MIKAIAYFFYFHRIVLILHRQHNFRHRCAILEFYQDHTILNIFRKIHISNFQNIFDAYCNIAVFSEKF